MSRVKTFDSTGIAPNGRLYAGDLNLMQDQYADLSNFTQTIDTGSLRVGDGSLQLLKYGAGEFRMSGALRVDGILRGLGGLYAGAFTTTQRDTIAAGFRPYGLVILNTSTNQYEWNQGTDASPVWVPLGTLTSAGVTGTRPAASIVNLGQLYFATDDNGGTLYRSNGTIWVRVALGLSLVSRGTLGARPAANASPSGNVWVATDDHGGTSYHTDGSSWQQMGAAIYGEVPIGAVMDWPWASSSVPAQCVLPYGQAVARITYPELNAKAAAAGYPHGAGDGTTTFNLPDYRGRSGIGKDDMGGTAANRITAAISGIAGITLGASGGTEGITLSTAQIPAHNHTITDPGHTHSVNEGTSGVGAGAGSFIRANGEWANNIVATNPNGIVAAVTGISIQNTGGGGVHANVQPGIIVNKIMRAL